MARSAIFALGILVCACIQARLLPELGLERLVNLPLLALALFATPYQLPSRLLGATVAGLAIDGLLLRPLGLTPLALSAAVVVGSALRSDVEGWPRRFAAAAAAIATGVVTEALLFGAAGESGGGAFGLTPSWFAVNLPLLLVATWIGSRRRERLRLDSTLRLK